MHALKTMEREESKDGQGMGHQASGRHREDRGGRGGRGGGRGGEEEKKRGGGGGGAGYMCSGVVGCVCDLLAAAACSCCIVCM